MEPELPLYLGFNPMLQRLLMQGLDFEDLLTSQATGDDDQQYFTSLCINPQGQLCLVLNRPLVFSVTVGDLLSLRPGYGRTITSSSTLSVAVDAASLSPAEQNHIVLIHNFSLHLSCGTVNHHPTGTTLSDQRACACDGASRNEASLSTVPMLQLDKLDINEGRPLLVLGLLLNLLKLGGHSVFYFINMPQVSQDCTWTKLMHAYCG